MSSKLPSEISLEELLASIEQETTGDQDSSVLAFINYFKLAQGKYKVRRTTLYNLYRKWTPEPVDSRAFGCVLTNYFELKDSGKIYYYMLNIEPLALTQLAQDQKNAKNWSKSRLPYQRRHFEDFLKKHEIKPGKMYLEGFLLHYLYDRWTYKNRYLKQLGYVNFSKMCRLYLKHERRTISRISWFGVDPIITTYLSQELIDELRQYRKEYLERKKEKQSKNKNKVSRPKKTSES
jgi:hypothetical protein